MTTRTADTASFAAASLGREKILSMLALLHRVRLFEERVKDLYREGAITGAIHLYIGQEAIAVGACSALEKTDFVVSTHRGHGHCLAKGGDLRRTMAELMGKETGYCHGRGGSMHLFDREIGLLGGNGLVGGGIPIALGAALSAQYRGTRQVTVDFFSEGASNHGTFHESLNMAALWKLPVVYVCENNGYAATTPACVTLSIANVADRAASYGMPGEVVDGNDILAVYDAVSRAVARAREGSGPTLVECKTYRLEGHCMVLDCVRDPEEMQRWKERDPILLFEQTILGAALATPEELASVREQELGSILEAERFGKESPWPSVESLGLGPTPVFATTS